MKRPLSAVPAIILVLVAFALCLVRAEQPSAGFPGLWQGELALPGGKALKVGFGITELPGGALNSWLSVIDQGVDSIPAGATVLEGDSLIIDISTIKAVHVLRLAAGGDSLVGSLLQGGASLPLRLARVESLARLNRPQEPKKPYPYRSEDIRYPNPEAGIELAGTITIPEGEGPFPAVLLIPGSGPNDRDEFIFGHRVFLVLADMLTRRGIAVLRADDRGVGGSGGDFAAAAEPDFASDTRAALAWLRTRPEIDRANIGILGHSEGALIGPLAAADNPETAFLVLLAGSVREMEDVLYLQQDKIYSECGISREIIDANKEFCRRAWELIRNEPDNDKAVEAIRAMTEEFVRDYSQAALDSVGISTGKSPADFRRWTSPWGRFLLDYNPASTFRRIKCPLLAIFGGTDLQVPLEEAEPLKHVFGEGDNPDLTIHLFEGHNHLFQHDPSGNPEGYKDIEETFSPEVAEFIADWILQKTVTAR